MIIDITLIVPPQDEKDEHRLQMRAVAVLAQKNISVTPAELSLVIKKRSVDARHGSIKIVLRVQAYIGELPGTDAETQLPAWKSARGTRRVIIIGAGPAGLFAALRLLEDGIKPIIIERGDVPSIRKKDIAAISTSGTVNADSNYCFGAGGAGTFSDGKLYTRSTKRGNRARILHILVHFGADAAILTDAHPHIGTDKLPAIVDALCKKITALGGTIHFHTRCTAFTIAMKNNTMTATGITAQDTHTHEQQHFSADAVIVATGHSASDIYELLARTAPSALVAKTCAIGVRIEHPRPLIDHIQYHGQETTHAFPAAAYRLTAQVDGRGVYSFCMCPGGYVVPATTENDSIVTNGMASSHRNSPWSNAAIVVETRPEDIPPEFHERAQQAGCPALAGLFFRTALEHETKSHGEKNRAPAQRLKDFLHHRRSASLPRTSYAPGITPSRLDEWLPAHITQRLIPAFYLFDRKMRGFIADEAVLIASETRTSTPVRMARAPDTHESVSIARLFPAGEGSGYAGGIISSALDGETTAACIIAQLAKETISPSTCEATFASAAVYRPSPESNSSLPLPPIT
ncbi:MAG: FAD-binding protein [Treponema sp.]|nr:FAD-binding protein [Treponema sp.]